MILLIDDDPVVRGWAARSLRRTGFVVLEAESASVGLGLFATYDIALVIQDFNLHRGGAELFGKLKAARPTVPVVVLTGFSPEYIAHVPFDAYLGKPCDTQDLLATVARFVDPPGRPRRA